jgi:hypothetical protein
MNSAKQIKDIITSSEKGMGMASTDTLPIETVAHIQSAGCK